MVMVEVSERILAAEDPAISTTIYETFINRGMRIITGIDGVERIEKNGNSRTLVYNEGGSTRTLDAGAIVLAVGWPGNIESLNLDKIGVKTERGFIQVDDYLRTTTENIFAAGDITGRMGLVQRAGYDARIAAG